MRTKNLNQTISFVLILAIALMLAGCSQPQKKLDQSPTVPEPQANMMGQADPSSMMHDNPEAMQKAMSAPENRQAMINMMSSSQMRPAMVDMMKDPAMRQAMTDMMADPAMKDTFAAMVKDPRLAPIAREALKE
ncbi:MAG: hypothetical protein H7X79_09985 [Sporomusaceae bacterium]|nr:hypothetical protein [Sporomusaceae bacterium]